MLSTLTGSLHPSNKDAISWNEKGIIVFGCHSTLVFVDVTKLKVFQTIELHKAAINQVCWRPSPDFLKADELELKCASSDISGRIHAWNVLTATSIASFINANSTTIDMKWPEWRDTNRDFLLTLHSNNTLVLWNALSGERVWEFRFSMNVFRFDVDPFDASNIAVSSVGSNLIILSSLSVKRSPSAANVTQIILREPDGKASKDSQFVAVKFHHAYAGLIFALFANKVICVEVASRQIVYTAVIDSHAPLCHVCSFTCSRRLTVQILPCERRDAFFLTHHNGFVSFRVAHVDYCDERVRAKLTYRRVCFSEAQRASNRLRLMGAAICPASQATVALLYNSGRLAFHQLCGSGYEGVEPYRIRSIEDYLSLSPDLANVYSDLRLTQYGLISSLCSTVTAVRVRPLDAGTFADASRLDRVHLAAIATSVGTIHLVNVLSGQIERDFQVHSCPIKCLEWGGNNTLISAAYSASLSFSATVRNDLFVTDIRTGAKKRIRQEADESPIELIRVSFYQCYLAISFRNEPLEIWDLASMRLLRRMSRRCPIIVDMAWSGKHHNFKTISDMNIYRENLVVLDNDNHLYHVVVKGLHVRDGKEVSTEWKSGATQLRCMVWKDDILAFGDSTGRLGVWDLARSQCRQTGLSQSTRGPVVKCTFSRLAGDNTLAVQHPTSVVLWDVDRLQAIQSFQHAGLSIIDADMCGVTPVYLTSDGMFRFAFDKQNGQSSNKPVVDADMPLLLRHDYVDALQSALFNTHDGGTLKVCSAISSAMHREDYDYLLKTVDKLDVFAAKAGFLLNYLGLAALRRFIDVVFHCSAIDAEDSDEGAEVNRLATNLQQFWRSSAYRKRAHQMTNVLLSCCKTENQLEQGIEKCIILGKKELAIYFLLNNDHMPKSNVVDFRLSALRACLLSANLQSEESQCLVKLTATNLIASNFITDGIQLLFLIDHGLDACKYLISQGLWEQSVLYSKMHPNCDFDEILLRYVDHLLNDQAHTTFAILILASLRKWNRCHVLIDTFTDPAVGDVLKLILTRVDALDQRAAAIMEPSNS